MAHYIESGRARKVHRPRRHRCQLRRRAADYGAPHAGYFHVRRANRAQDRKQCRFKSC